MGGFLLGIDAGSSSIKASLVSIDKGVAVATTAYPEKEMAIISLKSGWAEQRPETWWANLKKAVARLRVLAGKKIDGIEAIGISYQMHGLVVVDRNQNVLRPSIIWCDSRAVNTGENAFKAIGEDKCLRHLLNSPGNFTASKLKWVQDSEPELYRKIHKMMLPGDYLAMKLTGEIGTTVPGLSEGILWDFRNKSLAGMVLDHYGIDRSLVPPVLPVFSVQGYLSAAAAKQTGLKKGVPVAYRAGDQPNNAFSLNVLHPGEVAATAGTSGVIYGITDKPDYDPRSRVNTFVHVNHTDENPRFGVLLCINGTGILNRWIKDQTAGNSYESMNRLAGKSGIGSNGLVILPFGNGAERVLGNRDIQAEINGLNFNIHKKADLYRAAQEGIVFALKYGFDILQSMHMKSDVVKAGKSNMFLSSLFREAFVNTTGAVVELYNTDGAQGAARGAGIGAGIFKNTREAFFGLKTTTRIEPDAALSRLYRESYDHWLLQLNKKLI
ncbi:MAG TPA: FGGY family carbohydrate kinase [Cyclobacteriaceae bacterium]|nr:FGGY family carbohydrate kinase [Cyclobacteriaceae bacterium]